MTAVLNIVIPGLAILAIAITFFYGLRAFQHKSAIAQEPYSVGQQDVRRAMQVDIIRAGLFLVIALILLGVIGLSSPQAPENEPQLEAVPEVTNTALPATATVNVPPATTVPETAVPTESIATEPPPAQPTEPVAPTVEEPTAAPTVTSPPAPQTAVVTSEVGVWLRSNPGINGEQVEWLLNNTELIVLPGIETADELEWQQVRAPSGNEGWVARQFIAYSE